MGTGNGLFLIVLYHFFRKYASISHRD